jgi:alpha-D-ribose 1-methylphosphonate 5-triphosphate diphosphatase
MAGVFIRNGRVLLAGGQVAEQDIRIEGDTIDRIGGGMVPPAAACVIDAAGRYVLPGIVDIHGDAFERQIMPRPGVAFDLRVALLDSDSQMVANGITTGFHGITYSWEPGLRGRDNFRRLLDAMDELNGSLRCDTRAHMRYETYNIDAADEVASWVAEGRIGLLAFNDHTPEIYEKRHSRGALAKYTERTGLGENECIDLVERVLARAGEVPDTIERLAAAARVAGIPQLSHDDALPETRVYYNALGCAICEFPETRDTAEQARAYGNAIVMGAPNVVRGGSHNGSVSAADMIAGDLCTVLASDYYYPAQLIAAWKLHRQAGMALADAWALVSRSPAEAAGLHDRGQIAEGRRADIIVVDADGGAVPRVTATVAGGRPVYRA